MTIAVDLGRKATKTNNFRYFTPCFSTVFCQLKRPQLFKIYASVMKFNLLNVQRLSVSSFMA